MKASYLKEEPGASIKPKRKRTWLYRVVAGLIGLFLSVVLVVIVLFGVALVVCGSSRKA